MTFLLLFFECMYRNEYNPTDKQDEDLVMLLISEELDKYRLVEIKDKHTSMERLDTSVWARYNQDVPCPTKRKRGKT